jgi:hypothetical protein
MARKPNLIVILIDDLRFDETSASGHPYMKTPHIDRLAREGAMFENAFHPTPLCSPNRASILTGQYASRHGIIDNVGRNVASYRLDNYHIALQALGYETAHIGKWHMGNDSNPRPGYDHWVSFKGQGQLVDPILWENGGEHRVEGYMTDILNARAVEFVKKKRKQPFALFFAHKAVHPDLAQTASGTIDAGSIGGYTLPDRHKDLYQGLTYPHRPSMLPLEQVARDKPALKMMFEMRAQPASRDILAAMDGGTQEEIRKRADADRARRRQARRHHSGPLAGAAHEGQDEEMAPVLPVRVLERERVAVDRRHGLQGGAHGALEVHPLDPPPGHGRDVRPGDGPLRAQEPRFRSGPREGARDAQKGTEKAHGRRPRHLGEPGLFARSVHPTW